MVCVACVVRRKVIDHISSQKLKSKITDKRKVDIYTIRYFLFLAFMPWKKGYYFLFCNCKHILQAIWFQITKTHGTLEIALKATVAHARSHKFQLGIYEVLTFALYLYGPSYRDSWSHRKAPFLFVWFSSSPPQTVCPFFQELRIRQSKVQFHENCIRKKITEEKNQPKGSSCMLS